MRTFRREGAARESHRGNTDRKKPRRLLLAAGLGCSRVLSGDSGCVDEPGAVPGMTEYKLPDVGEESNDSAFRQDRGPADGGPGVRTRAGVPTLRRRQVSCAATGEVPADPLCRMRHQAG